MSRPVGFLGLGVMGLPIARNLARAGVDLVVWNRTSERTRALDGVRVARTPAEVFGAAETVITMLASEAASDQVLQRGTPAFASMVKGRTIVQMGTTSAAYSQQLEADVRAAGGRYVEAPVSGSRKPAEEGRLIGLLAGEAAADLQELLRPVCASTFVCGAVPNALRMKLAVNLFLIATVGALAEAAHLAERSGLDLAQFAAVLDAGPMASEVSRAKAAKLVAGDFSVQASIADVAMNARLVAEAARSANASSPLIDLCLERFNDSVAQGRGALDMIAVIESWR